MPDLTLKEKFIKQLSVGIPGIESKNAGNYTAQNPTSTAAGKYQFTSYWISKAKDKSIQAFAKRSDGVFKVPKDLEEFKKDPLLQDAYFKYYAGEVLYKHAIKAYEGENPLNLSLVQMGALFHYKPPYTDKRGNTGAYEQIKTGKLDGSAKAGVDGAKDSNASVAKYLDVVTKTIESDGTLPVIDKKEILESKDTSEKLTKSKEQIVEDFTKRNNAITNMKDLDPGAREELRARLFQEVADAGNIDIVNEQIEKERLEFKEETEKYKNLHTIFGDFDLATTIIDGKNDKRNVRYDKMTTEYGVGDVEKLKNDFPELAPYISVQKNKSGQSRVVINKKEIAPGRGFDMKTLPKFIEKFNKINADFFGEKYKNIELPDEVDKAKPPSFGKTFTSPIDALEQSVGYWRDQFSTSYRDSNKVESEMATEYPTFEKQLIDPKVFKPKVEETVSEKETKKTEEETTTNSTEDNKSTKEEEKNQTTNASGATDDYFNTELGLLNTQNTDDFSTGQTKQDLPIDAVMGLAMGIIGNKQAKDAKIPLRTEEVSDAIRNINQELRSKSIEGLPVEVEAAMKEKLAESTQAALSNIVNASAGNRASVLGNLGSVDANNKRGLVAIQLADYQAKEQAFSQYMESENYINEFNSRREIANHEINYREQKQKQIEGKQLATAGFSKLMDAIQYQQQNGPGSANDQYRSLLMQKMYGFDPKMKDDGSGTKRGTKSYFDAQKGLLEQDLKDTKELRERAGTLNPNQKNALDSFVNLNKEKKNISSFIDYLKKNPELDPSKISMDNLDLALEKNDFNFLTLERQKAIQSKELQKNEPGIISLTDDQINNPGPTTIEPMANLNSTISTSTPPFAPPTTAEAIKQNIGLMDEYYNNQ